MNKIIVVCVAVLLVSVVFGSHRLVEYDIDSKHVWVQSDIDGQQYSVLAATNNSTSLEAANALATARKSLSLILQEVAMRLNSGKMGNETAEIRQACAKLVRLYPG